MENKVFDELLASIREADGILKRQLDPAVIYQVPEVNIRKAREAMRMTQVQFAEMLSIRTKTLQLMEKGRRRPSAAIVSLCRLIMANPIFVHDTLFSPVNAQLTDRSTDEKIMVELKQLEEKEDQE